MKNWLYLTFIVFLTLFTGCSREMEHIKPVKQKITSSSQLAKDSSFIFLAKEGESVRNILYKRLRVLGNEKSRLENSAKIKFILDNGVNNKNIALLSKYLGFNDEAQFSKSVFTIAKRKSELNTRYDKIDNEIIQESYSAYLASDKNSTIQSRDPDFCVECPFNNCNECWGGTIPEPGCSTCLDPVGGGGGGGLCRSACNNKKQAELNRATAVYVAAIAACVGVGYGCAGAGTVVPGGGTVTAGILCYVGCAALDYYVYMQEITILENDYVTCVSGCN